MRANASNYSLAAALVAAAVTFAGCATEEYVDQQVAATNARIDEMNARVVENHRLAQGSFEHTVVMTDDSTKFDSNSAALSQGAMAALARFAERLKAENRNVHIEVVGHADSTGRTSYNLQLGQRRADAVVRYLHMQGVPLHRMSAISYGEAMPKAANEAAEGRAENRRVVLMVLA